MRGRDVEREVVADVGKELRVERHISCLLPIPLLVVSREIGIIVTGTHDTDHPGEIRNWRRRAALHREIFQEHCASGVVEGPVKFIPLMKYQCINSYIVGHFCVNEP